MLRLSNRAYFVFVRRHRFARWAAGALFASLLTIPGLAQTDPPSGLRGVDAPGEPVPLPAPTSTDQPVELLRNGGFEDAGANNPRNPRNWRWSGARGDADRRICDNATRKVAHAGRCALQFVNNQGKHRMRSVRQARKLPEPLGAAGDTLTLSLMAARLNVTRKLNVALSITYADGTTESLALTVPAAAKQNLAYTAFAGSLTLTGPVTRYDLSFSTSAKGRVRLDAVSLLLTPKIPDTAPQLISTAPGANAVDVPWDSAIVLTFSEPVNATDATFALTCAETAAPALSLSGAGTATLTLTPQTLLPVGDLCTLTVTASGVTDVDADDPPDALPADISFSFTTLAQTPDAADDAYEVAPNVGLDVPAPGLLANDQRAQADIPDAPITTDLGGQVSLRRDGAGRATGGFVYAPPANARATEDSFSYTLVNRLGESTATATLTLLDRPAVWFIDAKAPGVSGAPAGTLSIPFNSIAAYNAVAGGPTVRAGDSVYILSGEYAGSGLILKNRQAVYGQGITLAEALPDLPPFSPFIAADERPTISTFFGSGVLLAQDNTLRGFNLGDTASHAISGTSVGALHITEVSISSGSSALNLNGGALDIMLDLVRAQGALGTPALRLLNTTGSVTVIDGGLASLSGDLIVVKGGTAVVEYAGDLETYGDGYLLRVEDTTGGRVTIRDGSLSAVAGGVLASDAAEVQLLNLELARVDPIPEDMARAQALDRDGVVSQTGDGVRATGSAILLQGVSVRNFIGSSLSAQNSRVTVAASSLLDHGAAGIVAHAASGTASLTLVDTVIFSIAGGGIDLLAEAGGTLCAALSDNTVTGAIGAWGARLRTTAADAQITLDGYGGATNAAGPIADFLAAVNTLIPPPLVAIDAGTMQGGVCP